MASRKQIAAARRNIKKAQAANRKKKRRTPKRRVAKRRTIKRRPAASRKRRAPKRRVARRNPVKKSKSKKVGGAVVKVTGRKLYVGGATHSYKTEAAGTAAYRRMTTKKKVASFKSRYGKIKRVARKVTKGRNKGDTLGWTKQRRGKSRGKLKPRYMIHDVPPRNRTKVGKKRKPARRNPSRSTAELKRILRQYGYKT